MAAYAQRAGPMPVTLLDHPVLSPLIPGMRGDEAALRLAFYDLLLWGIGLLRLVRRSVKPRYAVPHVFSARVGRAAPACSRYLSDVGRERLDDPGSSELRARAGIDEGSTPRG